jgi:hypothetical protein
MFSVEVLLATWLLSWHSHRYIYNPNQFILEKQQGMWDPRMPLHKEKVTLEHGPEA